MENRIFYSLIFVIGFILVLLFVRNTKKEEKLTDAFFESKTSIFLLDSLNVKYNKLFSFEGITIINGEYYLIESFCDKNGPAIAFHNDIQIGDSIQWKKAQSQIIRIRNEQQDTFWRQNCEWFE